MDLNANNNKANGNSNVLNASMYIGFEAQNCHCLAHFYTVFKYYKIINYISPTEL